MAKLTAKQIRYFGTKAQRAALRRRRSGGSPAPRRSKRRAPQRSHMARKKRGGRRGKASILDAAIGLNAGLQMAEPFVEKNVHGHLMAGNFKEAAAAAKPAIKEAVSFQNLAQVAVPAVGARAVKWAGRKLGLGRIKLFGRRLI